MSGVEGVPADALLRALAAIDVPITMIDGSGRISFVNAAAEAVVGRTAAELSAVEHFSTIVGIEDRAERAIHHHEVATGGGSARRFRASVERPDGTVAHIGGAMAAVEAGNDGLVLLIGRDVGQEEERDATLGRLAAVCARMPIGVVIWEFVDDPSGTATLRLTTANDAASRAAGVDLASRAGEFVEHVFPDAAAGLLARVAPLRGKEGVLELGDVGHHAPGAPSAVFRRLAVGLPNDSVAVVFEDVTQLRAEDHRRRRDAERLLTVADEERRRIAIGVHDTIVQQLAAAALLVDGMTIRPASPEAGERLAAVSTILRDSQRALRDLLFELSPPELTEGGLAAAVNAAVDYLFARADAAVAVDVTTPPGIPAIVETVAYRIIAEALSNTAKHAHANAVIVRVAPAGRGLVVTVADDGSGFSDPDAARRLDRPGHIGMSAMRQRAASIGGSVDIASGRAGTVVTARLPLDVAADITAGTAPSLRESSTEAGRRFALSATGSSRRCTSPGGARRPSRHGATWRSPCSK